MSDFTFVKQNTQDAFTTEKVDVVKNSLLGDYNKNGNYVIAEEIVNELVLLKKIKDTTFNNSVFCSANLEKYGKLSFEIVFKKNTKLNIAIAELYLLETVEKVNGYVYNTIKTPLVKYSEPISKNFVSMVMVIFNVGNANAINDEDDEGGKELKDKDFDLETNYIETRKNFTNIVNNLTSNDFETAYESYFNKRLEILKGQNSLFSKAVLKNFNAEYSKIENYFLVDKKGKVKYKALNELLDNAIESVSGLKVDYKQDENLYLANVNAFTSDFSNKIETLKSKAFRVVGTKHKEVSNVLDQIEKNYSKDEKPIKTVASREGNKIKFETSQTRPENLQPNAAGFKLDKQTATNDYSSSDMANQSSFMNYYKEKTKKEKATKGVKEKVVGEKPEPKQEMTSKNNTTTDHEINNNIFNYFESKDMSKNENQEQGRIK